MLRRAGGEEYDVAVSAASNATLVSVTAPTIAGYTGVVRLCALTCPSEYSTGYPTGTLRGTPRGTRRYPTGRCACEGLHGVFGSQQSKAQQGEGGLSLLTNKQANRRAKRGLPFTQTNKQTKSSRASLSIKRTNKPRPGQARALPQTQTNKPRPDQERAFPQTSAAAVRRSR